MPHNGHFLRYTASDFSLPEQTLVVPDDFDQQFDLSRFCWFDPELNLNETFGPRLDRLAREVLVFHNVRVRADTMSNVTFCLSTLIANLLQNCPQAEGDSGFYVAIHLNSNLYSRSRYTDPRLTYRAIKYVLDYLTREDGEVRKHIGFNDRVTGIRRVTRLSFSNMRSIGRLFHEGGPREEELENSVGSTSQPILPRPLQANSDRLSQLSQSEQLFITNNTSFSRPTHQRPVRRRTPHNPIVLKDENKRPIYYEDTDEICRMRNEVSSWNEFARFNWPDLFISNEKFRELDGEMNQRAIESNEHGAWRPNRLDLSKRFLVRIFNNSAFDQGGRLYRGWWQEIPSRYRKYVTINGHPTVELDYSNMQVAMLYAQQGQTLDGDAYSIDGVDRSYRKLIKKIMQQLLNAQEGQGLRRPAASALPGGWTFEDIQAALKEKHSGIARFFRSGVGLRLQREDADIAVRLITSFMNEDQLVLPVHDSFIVGYRHMGTLQERMRTIFSEVFGTDIGLSVGQILIEEFRNPEDDDAVSLEQNDDPAFHYRMYATVIQPEYSEYRERMSTFINSRSYEWQLRYCNGPLW